MYLEFNNDTGKFEWKELSIGTMVESCVVFYEIKQLTK
jgi:hypothetical protein